MKSLLNKILVFVLTASVVFSLLTCVTFAEPENGGNTAGTGTGTTQEEIDSEVQTQDPVTDGFDAKVSSDYAYKDYIAKYTDAATPDREIVLSGKDAVEFDAETGKTKGNCPLLKFRRRTIRPTLAKALFSMTRASAAGL